MGCTRWDDVPIFLNASDIAGIMRLSKPVVYSMMKRADFPAIKVSDKRVVVPKDALIRWLDGQAGIESR